MNTDKGNTKLSEKIDRGFPLSAKTEQRLYKEFFPNYLIYSRKERKAICTACNTWIKDEMYEQNESVSCPNCKTIVTAKPKGKKTIAKSVNIATAYRRGNKLIMVTRAFSMRYKKEDWNHIVEHGKGIYRDNKPVAIYTFEEYKQGKENRANYWSDYWSEQWASSKKLRYDGYLSLYSIDKYIDTKTMYKAIGKLWLGYKVGILRSYVREACLADSLRVIDALSKWPQIELVYKAGLETIVERQLLCNRNSRILNWKGENLLKILKLSNRKQLKDVIENKMNILQLETYKILCKHNIPRPEHEYKNVNTNIKTALKMGDRENINVYKLYKYLKNNVDGDVYIAGRERASWYVDYYRQAKELGYPITEDSVLFPKNLKLAHDQVTIAYQQHLKNIDIEKKQETSKKINRIARSIADKALETEEFTISPIEDYKELVLEGISLNHCVASYDKKIINGTSYIWKLRKTAEADVPYYTVETTRAGEIKQIRGKHNCIPDVAISEFVELWKVSKFGRVRSHVQ